MENIEKQIEAIITTNPDLKGVYDPLIVEQGYQHSFTKLKGEFVAVQTIQGDAETLDEFMIVPLELGTILEIEECVNERNAQPYTYYEIFTSQGWKRVDL